MFNPHINLRTTCSLKCIILSLDCVKNIWFTGSTLLFFNGVHCSAKKIFALVWILVTDVLAIKKGETSGIFYRYKMF